MYGGVIVELNRVVMSDIVTETIHSRGWTVWDACEHWGFEYPNFRRKVRRVLSGKCKNEREYEQLIDMCNGLRLKVKE